MSTIERHLQELAAATSWTYAASAESATEPAAWAARTLVAHKQLDAAHAPAQWLAELQQPSGAIGVSTSQCEPCWPTGLAMLAWRAVDRAAGTNQFHANVRRAADWCLAARGEPGTRSPMIGHDTTLVGWSWAAATHSWLEPTCFAVMGLAAAGLADHPRTIEGRRLIVDRLLHDGGANYGNTLVLGQQLLPHVQPSGIAMMAIAGQPIAYGNVEQTLQYLARAVAVERAPASLSFACLGLTAHGRRPANTDGYLTGALEDGCGQRLATYELALLLVAAQPRLDWLGVRSETAPPAGGGA